MSEGLSFESFAGVVKCGIATIYRWTKDQPLFREAKKEGEAQCMLFYEKLGRMGMLKPGFNSTMWIFQMKCRFHKYGFNPENQQTSFIEDDDETGFEFVGESEKPA